MAVLFPSSHWTIVIPRKRCGAIGPRLERALPLPRHDWPSRVGRGWGPAPAPRLPGRRSDAIGQLPGSTQRSPTTRSLPRPALPPRPSPPTATQCPYTRCYPFYYTRYLYFSFDLFDFETVWQGLWPRLCETSGRGAFLFPCVHHHYTGRHYFRVYSLSSSRCPGNVTIVIFTVITSWPLSRGTTSRPSNGLSTRRYFIPIHRYTWRSLPLFFFF